MVHHPLSPFGSELVMQPSNFVRWAYGVRFSTLPLNEIFIGKIKVRLSSTSHWQPYSRICFFWALVQFMYRQTPYHHSVYLFPVIPNGVVYTFLAYTQMDGCASCLTQGDLTLVGGFCKYMYHTYCPCIGIASETGIIKTAFNIIITAPFCPNRAILL